jgi:pimeloyl-ACP methyl ester carboxylesterase
MGGYIAFEMMRRAPDRVERLDTSAPSDTPEQTVRVLTKGPDGAPVCKFPAPHFEFPTSGEEPRPASSMFFVAKFDGFVLAGRCAGRDRGRDFRAVVERQMNTNRRIATWIENLMGLDGRNSAHSAAPVCVATQDYVLTA